MIRVDFQALREKLDATTSRISEHTEDPWYKHKSQADFRSINRTIKIIRIILSVFHFLIQKSAPRQRKVADIVVEFTNYTEESYSNVKRTIKSDFGRVRVDDPIEYERKTTATDKTTFYWSEEMGPNLFV